MTKKNKRDCKVVYARNPQKKTYPNVVKNMLL